MTKLMEKTNQDSECAIQFENYKKNIKVADVANRTIGQIENKAVLVDMCAK